MARPAAGFPASGVLLLAAYILLPIGLIRFSRTGLVAEAFRFGLVLTAISKIGWLRYLAGMVLLAVLYLVLNLLFIIPYVGWIVALLLVPPFMISGARLICLLYGRAGRS